MNPESHIVLPDGRRLAYARFGDPSGVPVMYFHGSPSSRLEPLVLGDAVWRGHGLHVVAPDRPGMGGSDYQPGRGIADWPADVAALADELGWEKFGVLGYSGGGVYAAVCAAHLAPRLSAAVIVSGGWRMDGPECRTLPFPNRMMLWFARHARPLLRLMVMAMGAMGQGEPEKELAEMKRRVPPADHAAFAAPGRLAVFGEVIHESLRQGTAGPADDFRLYVRDLGFRPEAIAMPLHLFHGGADAHAPLALAQRMAKAIPGATLTIYKDDAHISTLCNHHADFARVLKA